MAQEVDVPAGDARLSAALEVPDEARGAVVFAHGSGSGRHSARNQRVAAELNRAGLATLLFDMLTPGEERIDRATGHLRFDVELLGSRLWRAARWLLALDDTSGLPLAVYGASTGAAALVAAAELGDSVHAVVSRGGRPDLAGDALARVLAPTLLIVGSRDEPVRDLNEAAFRQLRCRKRLSVVPGASHLFEEPGTLEEVSALALAWYDEHLPAAGERPSAHTRMEHRP